MNEKNIGIILKELRQSKGLTQKEIASSLIITPQTISKWENGISSPSLEMLVALSEIYEVSVDDLLKGTKDINDVTVVKEKGSLKFSIILYVMLGIMVMFGILSLFFDYAVLWITKMQIDQSTFIDVYPAIYVIDERINLFMAVVMISSPVVIGILSILDKKQFLSLLVSNVVLIYFVSVLGRYMGHPEFSEPRLGMIFVFMFLVALLIGIGLQLVSSKSTILEKLVQEKAYLVFSVVAYIIAAALPVTYRYIQYYENRENPFIDAFTYYEAMDQVIVLLMMGLGTMVLLNSYTFMKKTTAVASLLMVITLLYTTIVYIFNSGLIIPSLLMYIYLLFLGATFKKENYTFFMKTKFPISVLTILEVVSIGFYVYLLTLDGDLFFYNIEDGNPPYYDTIRNSNFKYGSLTALHLILLVIPMFFRFVKLNKLSISFYVIWFAFECWFLFDMYQYYIKVGYRMTDGIFYFVAPVLISIYGIIWLIIWGSKKLKKQAV